MQQRIIAGILGLGLIVSLGVALTSPGDEAVVEASMATTATRPLAIPAEAVLDQPTDGCCPGESAASATEACPMEDPAACPDKGQEGCPFDAASPAAEPAPAAETTATVPTKE